VGRKLFMQDARFGPGLDVLLVITVRFGFIARATLLSAQVRRPHWARPKLIMPVTFAVTPLVLFGLLRMI